MAELAQDGVEHDAAERIVLDAEDAQRRQRLAHAGIALAHLRCAAGVRRLEPHRQRERGAAAPPRRHGDVAAHHARELLDRRQSEPRPAIARGDRHIGLRERAEQPLDLRQCQPDTAVRNCESHPQPVPAVLATALGRGDERHCAGLGEFHRIVDQVLQRGPEADRIADHERRQIARNVDVGLQALGGCAARERIAGAAGQRAQIEQILAERRGHAVGLGGVDE